MSQVVIYGHADQAPESDSYLVPVLRRLLEQKNSQKAPIFEIGAGNGYVAHCLEAIGYDITGIEISLDGVEKARSLGVKVQQGSAYDDIAGVYGTYDFVYSLEVIEHLYSPKMFFRNAYDLLSPGGVLVVSTPYHGYLKNLMLAVTNKMDQHFTVLWDHGHIKFWSVKTLSDVLRESGFEAIEFRFAGRFYPFSKSMVAVARRPRGG